MDHYFGSPWLRCRWQSWCCSCVSPIAIGILRPSVRYMAVAFARSINTPTLWMHEERVCMNTCVLTMHSTPKYLLIRYFPLRIVVLKVCRCICTHALQLEVLKASQSLTRWVILHDKKTKDYVCVSTLLPSVEHVAFFSSLTASTSREVHCRKFQLRLNLDNSSCWHGRRLRH